MNITLDKNAALTIVICVLVLWQIIRSICHMITRHKRTDLVPEGYSFKEPDKEIKK